MSSTESYLPAPRLLVTTHDADGISVFKSDSIVPLFHPMGVGKGAFATFDTRPSVPVSNTEEPQDFGKKLPRCPPNGVLFSISDIPPGHGSPMHRTHSADWAVIVSGEIVLALDGGEEKTAKAGDFIIQGGATHAWVNRSDKPYRIGFVVVSAEPIKMPDGTEMEETVFKKENFKQ